MAKKKRQGNDGLGLLNTTVNKLLMSLDDEFVTDDNLSAKDAELKSLIGREMELARGTSGGSIIDFSKSLNKNLSKGKSDLEASDDLADYVTKNSGNIYQYYNERYRNKFLETQDLNFISKFIPSVAQAINLYVTHIVSSDDLSGMVKRNLHFGSSVTPSDVTTITDAIETFEKDNKFLMRMKNQVIRNTLISGNYYIYAPSYQKLFTDYQKTLDKAKKNGGVVSSGPNGGMNITNFASEGASGDNVSSYGALEHTISLESDKREVMGILEGVGVGDTDKFSNLKVKDELLSGLSSVDCIESVIPLPVLEEIPGLLQAANEDSEIRKKFDTWVPTVEATKNTRNRKHGASDGAYDLNGKKDEDTFNISGTYIKYIDAKNIIKVKILDEVVGYFYVEARNAMKPKATVTFSNGEWSNISKQSSIEKIATMLSEKVAKQFSTKFVADNVEFKKLIADCIMANGVVNKQYKIQFIPKEDMFEFKIDEDSEGNGTSVLASGLWTAKILASIKIRKTLNYVNNSGNKTVAYIKRGNADVSGRNQVQRVIRNVQERNITFNDIIGDSVSMFHKYAADGTIVMPTSRAGNKLVEFETMEGQTVDMATDYEKELENQVLTSMGTPPLLIEQSNNADFSKSYTTAHIGFAGRVAGLQSDFEETITALYKRFIENIDIDKNIKANALSSFEFRLPRPKALSCTNNNEIIDAASAFAEKFTNLRYGDVDETNKDKITKLKYEIVKSQSPFINWDELEKITTNVEIESSKVNSNASNESDDMGDDEV